MTLQDHLFQQHPSAAQRESFSKVRRALCSTTSHLLFLQFIKSTLKENLGCQYTKTPSPDQGFFQKHFLGGSAPSETFSMPSRHSTTAAGKTRHDQPPRSPAAPLSRSSRYLAHLQALTQTCSKAVIPP